VRKSDSSERVEDSLQFLIYLHNTIEKNVGNAGLNFGVFKLFSTTIYIII
jgi:hypothetical protein